MVSSCKLGTEEEGTLLRRATWQNGTGSLWLPDFYCRAHEYLYYLPHVDILSEGSTKENENMPVKKDDLPEARIHSK